MTQIPATYGRPHPKARFVLTGRYPRFIWKENGRSQSIAVHRWVWQHFHGPVPAGRYVRFRDGDHWNWAIKNLELATPQELGKQQLSCATRPGRKECTRCHTIKPLAEFRSRKLHTGLGYTAACRSCLQQYAKTRRAKPEARKQDTLRQRARRERDREGYNTYHRNYRQRKGTA